MKKILPSVLLFVSIMALHLSCQTTTTGAVTKTDTVFIKQQLVPLRDRVLTKEERIALTPDSVIQELKNGNKRFINNDLTARDHSAMVRDAAAGQYPKAVILSCLDSRVPIEDIFDKGIGDIFVARVAGNIANDDILGSLEYGCKVAGAKLILVIGHGSCGAVKAAIENVKMGNITRLLSNIKPAIAESGNFKGDMSTKNPDYVTYVTKNNVVHTVAVIKARSSILKEMSDKGEIKIIAAYYDLHTGEVKFLE